MEEDIHLCGAFAVPDFGASWELADASANTDRAEEDGVFHLDDAKARSLLASEISKPLNLSLPEFPPLDVGPLQELDALEASSISSANDTSFSLLDFDQDHWLDAAEPQAVHESRQLLTWESFYKPTAHVPRVWYLSDQSPGGFDAVLASKVEDSGRVLKSRPLYDSLLNLLVGRESILFRYDSTSQQFEPRLPNGRHSGHTLESCKQLESAIIASAQSLSRIRGLATAPSSGGSAMPTSIALHSEISNILDERECYVFSKANEISTLLQLSALFDESHELITALLELLDEAAAIKTEGRLLSFIFNLFVSSDYQSGKLRSMYFRLLVAASRPWRAFTSTWLGLSVPVYSPNVIEPPSFVTRDKPLDSKNEKKSVESVDSLDYSLDQEETPDFLGQEESQLALETGTNLHILRHHGNADAVKVLIPKHAEPIEWQHSWEGIENVVRRAKAHEEDIRNTLKTFKVEDRISDGGPKRESPADVGADSNLEIRWSEFNFDQAISDVELGLQAFPDAKGKTDTQQEARPDFENGLGPPIHMLGQLSFGPTIKSQAALVDKACLRLLVRDNNIRLHLSMLYRFHLLADGVFSCRLTHALFDPDYSSAERRKGHQRLGTNGLKLGSRETWPPAGSELRLALMGVLTESYFPGAHVEQNSLFREEMPGGLSFSLRDLPEQELQQCMDPNTIYALDFLRLQYEAPAPLDTIITPSSLAKYDMVFKLLLMVKRMVFVVEQLHKDLSKRMPAGLSSRMRTLCQRFRLESHHFIYALCSYFYESIAVLWIELEECITEAEQAASDNKPTSTTGRSVAHLRDFHEQILDRIMFTLLLRKRQSEVMKLLEDIFTQILQFVQLCSTTQERVGQGNDGPQESQLREIFTSFQKKVAIFVNVCRGLAEKKGRGGTSFESGRRAGGDGGNTLAHLVLKFEMNGFYGDARR